MNSSDNIQKALSNWNIPKLNLTPNFWAVAVAMEAGYNVVSLEGGSRSGKTYAILQWIVLASLSPKDFMPDFTRDRLITRCLRREAANARDSIWRDLNGILATLNIHDGERGFLCNRTSMTWTFPNGSEIICGGSSDKDKLHGIEQDIVFFNEVMQIPKASFDQANLRTKRAFILDWNPSLNDHWVFREGFDKTSNWTREENKEQAGKPKCCYFHSTYKDNVNCETGEKNLSSKQIAAIEEYEPTPANIANGKANQFMWDVYGLGKRGLLEGRVIPVERIQIIDDEEFPGPTQWQLHGYGLDWGYKDPTTLIECALWNNKLYVRERVYETELIVGNNVMAPEQNSMFKRLKEFNVKKTDAIVADSARADLNAALSHAGYTVIPADKIAGSIVNGINILNSRIWCVTDSSDNIKRELENYVWKKTRYGVDTNQPIDKWNHAIDAIRYWATTFLTSGNIPIGSNIEEYGKEQEVEYGCITEDYYI